MQNIANKILTRLSLTRIKEEEEEEHQVKKNVWEGQITTQKSCFSSRV